MQRLQCENNRAYIQTIREQRISGDKSNTVRCINPTGKHGPNQNKRISGGKSDPDKNERIQM